MLDYITNDKKIISTGSWEIGKSYLGRNARYAGVMYTKSNTKGQGVEYWGNANTGLPESSKIESSTKNITAGVSYAVFVHNSSLSISYNNISSYLTTLNSDSDFNFTIPDIETLGFLYNAVRTPEFKLNSKGTHNNNIQWIDFKDEYYLSSTNLKINNIVESNYIHIQNMGDGFTSTCSTENIHKVKAVLLIPLL